MENLSTFLLFLKITRLTKIKDNFCYDFHQLLAVSILINYVYTFIKFFHVLFSDYRNSNSFLYLRK